MNITDYLFEKASGLIKRFPEVRDDGRGFEMADDGGVELETGEFLYGLVRVIKPTNVLTTGVYTGISDMYVAQALKDNKFGQSQAIEFEKRHLDRAVELWKRVGVKEQIEEHLMSSLDFEPSRQYQFMFLDTEPQIRFKELIKFFPYLDEGGYVGIHDLHRHMGQNANNPDHPSEPHWPWGEVLPEMKQLVAEKKLVPMHFPTPRGLTFFYKPHREDFKWTI